MSIDDEILTLSYPRRSVETIITGLQDPLNEHLVKLAGFDFPPETKRHFRSEAETWLTRVQALRFKPRRRPGSFKFYYDLFFDYPFGGVEVENMTNIIKLIERQHQGTRATKSPEEMVEWLRDVHTTLAQRLSAGQSVLDLIPD